MSKEETIRRLRLGDLQRFLRKRYGHSLPDDDAGREDLRELLLLASLAYNPERTMRSMIKTWVKWMAQTEAEQLMDDITRTPIYLRKPSARLLGDRLGLLRSASLALRRWPSCSSVSDRPGAAGTSHRHDQAPRHPKADIGYALLHCICPLMTQSGHRPSF
jgi:hypothetical protein